VIFGDDDALLAEPQRLVMLPALFVPMSAAIGAEKTFKMPD
jgi:hypothetical protein